MSIFFTVFGVCLGLAAGIIVISIALLISLTLYGSLLENRK